MLLGGRGVTIRPKELRPSPASRPGTGAFSPSLPSQPFAGAQREAHDRVVHALSKAPKQPTPYIPRVPNPTPRQTAAALAIAHHAQDQALGPNPSPEHRRAYQQEILDDPRQREYVATLRHYAKAAEDHQAELVGRVQAGGGHSADSALTPAGMKISREAAIRAGRELIALSRRESAGPGRAPKDIELPLFHLASIKIPGSGAATAALGHALATVTPGLQSNTPETKFAKALGGDALAVGELPFVGGYQAANAGLQAALHGNLKPGEQLAKGIAQGLEHGAAGELLQGHLSKAEDAVREHPLFSALEALGASGIAGRSAGALARGAGGDVAAGGVRGALARAGSQVRPPVAFTEDAGAAARGTALEQRTYSPDLIRKAVQVLADKRREPVLDAQGRPVTVSDRGRQVQVLRPKSGREQRAVQTGRANFTAARTQAGETVQREEIRKAANAAESPGRSPLRAVRGATARELTHLVATGTIRGVDTFKADLEKRAAMIERAIKDTGSYRTGKELDRATENARLLRRAAENPKVVRQIPAIVATGLRIAGEAAKGDARSEALDIHPHDQLVRAALSEYALAHMDATHFTVGDHARLEREARVAERGARSTLRDAQPGTPEHAAAAAEHRRLQAHRIAVSGRGLPDAVVEHETKVQAARDAKQAVRDAQDALSRAERVRARQVGVHASRRGSQGLRAATEHERKASELQAEKVKAAKAGLRAARSEASRAIAEARRSKLPEAHARLRNPDGTHLSNEAIEAHARAHGRDPATLAYFPHVLEAGSKRAYHQQMRPGTRPGPSSLGRKGHLYQRGATEVGMELVRDELTGKATTAHKVQALDKFTQEVGLRRPDGQFLTPKEGLEAAARFEHDGESDYVPMRAFAARLSKETRERLAKTQNPAEMETAHLALLNDRVVTDAATDGTRNVVLVPKHLKDALEAHLEPAGGLERRVQLLNAPFRMAVLPQPRWLTGNFIEPYLIRLPLSGAGINVAGLAMDIRAGSKVLKAMERSGDPAQAAAAKEIRAQQFGGLFVGRRGASVRRTYQDFPEGSKTRATLYGAHVVRNLPVVKQLGDMALALPHAFFHINRVIESFAQRQAFGKSVRQDIQQFTGSWSQTVLLGQKAIEDVGKGLVNTAAQQRFMAAQHELLGQYEGFDPVTRKVVQTVAPFLPWTLASARFVFWTLPAHHTVAFTALLKAAQSVQTEWEAQHADVPPGTLKDAVVRKDGGLVDLERYTPYGATSPVVQGDLSNLTNTVLPQVSGAVEALKGKDPFGRDLEVPKTPGNPEGKPSGGQKAGIALNNLFEALVPLVAQGRRLQEGGGTAYGNSFIWSPKTKPNSSHGMSALERTLSPLRPTYLKKGSGGRSASSSAAQQRAIEHSEGGGAGSAGEQALQRAIERAGG